MKGNLWRTIFGLLATLALVFSGLAVSSGSALAAPTIQDEEPEEVEFTGTVVDESIDLIEGTFDVLVENEDGSTTVYTVLAPEDFDLDQLEDGDTVEVEGTLNEDGDVVATSVKIEEAEEEDDEGEEEGEEENFFCANPDERHPFGDALAESYDVSYEEVMAWFCESEVGFGQIMLALQTSEITGDSADDLLNRRAGGEGWGQIWQDLDLIGNSADAGPPGERGRPEWAGPPEDAGPPEGAGPPEHAGPPEDSGAPDWAGPPEHAGPPDRGD